MFIAIINKDEDLFRVLSSDNRSLYKGTKKECEDYIEVRKFKIIPMCGGYDFVIRVHKHSAPKYYFITNEGISTHPTMQHIQLCINGRGFRGYLDIQSRALPTALEILKQENLPEYFIKYLKTKIDLWP